MFRLIISCFLPQFSIAVNRFSEGDGKNNLP